MKEGKRKPEMHRYFIQRTLILAGILLVVFGAIFIRLGYMVRVGGDTYSETASTKATKSIALYGRRGTIYDANLVPLAYDRTSYDVTFYRNPSRTKDSDREAYTQVLLKVIQLVEANGKSTVNDFWMKKDENGKWVFSSGSESETVEAKRKEQWRSNFSLSKNDEANWFKTLCDKYFIPANLDDDMKVKILALWQESRMNNYNSTPCTIATDVGFQTVSEIEVRSMELDGIEISESTSRVYPQGTTACHIIGYVSKISTNALEEYRAKGYPNDALIGSDGIERSLEDQLSPYISYRQGQRVIERNTRGKVVRELDYVAPTDGNSVVLTIDVDLQNVMREALVDNIEYIRGMQEETVASDRWQRRKADILAQYAEEEREISYANSGALVAMDPNSGRVLGMVSYPDYDLSYFNGGVISLSDWDKIREGNDPLYNRAISTKDSPGSIFKLVTALAALSEGKTTLEERIDCLGSFGLTDPSHPSKCWTTDTSKHQNQTVVEALKNSCNFYFYTMGYRLGSAKIYKWAAALGLTSKTNIELPGETTSFVGNQSMLYDPDVAIEDQYTAKPQLAANAIRRLIDKIGKERNIEYSQERIDEVVKKLLDIAVSYDTKYDWRRPIREILLYDLNLPVDYIVANYIGNTITTYIQELQWTPNESIMLAIGYSITQVSPIAVARYTAAIANGGTVYDAQIVDKIIAPDGTVVLDKQPVVANRIQTNEAYFAAIKRGMEDVTSPEENGTAAKFYEGIDYIAAKTGTSQRTLLDVENNAWQVAYAPKEDPQIVVVAYVQNGYQGAYTSQMIRTTIEYYLTHMNRTENANLNTDYTLAD